MACFLHKMAVFIQFFCIFCISAFKRAENECGNTFPLLARCILALNADFRVRHSCIFQLKMAFQMNVECCFAGLHACIKHIIHLCEIHCILCNGAITYAFSFSRFSWTIHLYRKCASHCVYMQVIAYLIYSMKCLNESSLLQ